MTTPSEKARSALLKKLPELGNRNMRIMLQRSHFKKMTDLEFIILWHMPGLDIMIEPRTKIYVEQRRKALGARFDDTSGYDLRGEEEVD